MQAQRQSSTTKGDAFELKVHNCIQNLISSGEFYAREHQSKIYWKRKYYSAIRQRDIIFDLAVEVFLSGHETPSLVIVIECKDYKTSVPVNDLEEFESKIGQLIGQMHCLKGIVVTSSAFDSGAITLAKNLGIGLAQMSIDSKIEWLVPRKDTAPNPSDASAETTRQLSVPHGRFLAYDDANFFRSLPSLLIAKKIIDRYSPPLKNLQVPFRSVEQIEDVIQEFPYSELYSSDRLNEDKLRGLIAERCGAKVLVNQELGLYNNETILGHLSLDPPVISLSRLLNGDVCRRRFTFAHEVGHLMLHRDLLLEFVEEIRDFDGSLGRVEFSDEKLNRSLEIQANIFASRLLLPTEPLLQDVRKYFREQNLHKPYIYWDHQPVNNSLAHGLLFKLKNKYLASKEASRIRLIQMGLIRTPATTEL